MIPITDAMDIVTASFQTALAPLCGIHPDGYPKCYWHKVEEGAPLPVMVYQSADGGGSDASMLGLGGWQGDMIVKVLARTNEAAKAGMAGVADALMNHLTVSGAFTIQATFVHQVPIPPLDNVWTAAHKYRVTLFRA